MEGGVTQNGTCIGIVRLYHGFFLLGFHLLQFLICIIIKVRGFPG